MRSVQCIELVFFPLLFPLQLFSKYKQLYKILFSCVWLLHPLQVQLSITGGSRMVTLASICLWVGKRCTSWDCRHGILSLKSVITEAGASVFSKCLQNDLMISERLSLDGYPRIKLPPMKTIGSAQLVIYQEEHTGQIVGNCYKACKTIEL